MKTANISSIGMWHQMHFLDLQQMDRWFNGCSRTILSRLLHARISWYSRVPPSLELFQDVNYWLHL